MTCMDWLSYTDGLSEDKYEFGDYCLLHVIVEVVVLLIGYFELAGEILGEILSLCSRISFFIASGMLTVLPILVEKPPGNYMSVDVKSILLEIKDLLLSFKSAYLSFKLVFPV